MFCTWTYVTWCILRPVIMLMLNAAQACTRLICHRPIQSSMSRKPAILQQDNSQDLSASTSKVVRHYHQASCPSALPLRPATRLSPIIPWVLEIRQFFCSRSRSSCNRKLSPSCNKSSRPTYKEKTDKDHGLQTSVSCAAWVYAAVVHAFSSASYENVAFY